MTYLLLFWEFFKIGLFSIGGGAATIPFLAELPNRYNWFTTAELVNFIAISESTPGPIGVNMATYAGYNAAGLLGGVIATAGLVFPSVIIITIVARFMAAFSENKTVKAVFYGIRPAVTALIASAFFGIAEVVFFGENDMFKEAIIVNIPLLILFAVAFALMNIKKLKTLHPAVWIVAAAAIGIIAKL